MLRAAAFIINVRIICNDRVPVDHERRFLSSIYQQQQKRNVQLTKFAYLFAYVISTRHTFPIAKRFVLKKSI